MEKKKKPYHHGALRKALISEALKVIDSEGVEAVTMRALGQATGVSRTAAYRHFDNKVDLLCAVAEEGFGIIAERYQNIMEQATDDGLANLETLGRGYVAFAMDYPNLFRLMFGPELAGHARTDTLKAAVENSMTLLVSTVVQCQEQGTVQQGNPLALASILWAGMHGLATVLVDGQLLTEEQAYGVPVLTTDKVGSMQKSSPMVLDLMVGVILRGLAPEPGGQ